MSEIKPVEQRLLTVKEVAVRLSSSVRHVWRLIARGDLAKPVRLGRAVRIQMSDWEAYMEKIRRERDGRAVHHQMKEGK